MIDEIILLDSEIYYLVVEEMK